MFHKHVWIEIERFYAEPTTDGFEVNFVSTQFIERMKFGVTTIRFRCECGALKTEEILGKPVKENGHANT